MSKVSSILARRDELIYSLLDARSGRCPLVERIAGQLRPKLPPCFTLDDLVQEGIIGLIQAATVFDSRRGVAFGAFARKRIKGQMIESVRKRNWTESTREPIAEHSLPREYKDSCFDDGNGQQKKLNCTPDPRVNVDAEVEQMKRRDLVDGGIAALPKRQAVLIEMYYRRDVPLQDMAYTELFNVNPSRVSQIHTTALRALRKHFELRGTRAA